MVWRCPQCGVVNDDSAARCARLSCTGQKRALPGDKTSGSEAAPWKHADIVNITLSGVMLFFLTFIVISILPQNDLLTGYGVVGAECLVIYGLGKIYGMHVFSIKGMRRACGYGLAIGAVLVAIQTVGHVDPSNHAANGYDIFIPRGLGAKYLSVFEIVVLTPLVEEALFRGYMYRILKVYLPPKPGHPVKVDNLSSL